MTRRDHSRTTVRRMAGAPRRRGDRIRGAVAAAHMSPYGTSQPCRLPRRTAGYGSKADTQPLAGLPERERASLSLIRRSSGCSAPRKRLSSPPLRNASADARHVSCWVISPGGRDGRCRPGASAPLPFAHTGKSCSLIPELPAGRAEVLFSGSADAVGKHRTQAFKFAVYQYSHRAFASDLARVKVLDQGIGTP